MPSADAGARDVRPADVEHWFADIGLEPLERADREGIASWDLLLDGRRRHDLRVTVILDPSYCYPESWDLPFPKRLLALDKHHEEIRA